MGNQKSEAPKVSKKTKITNPDRNNGKAWKKGLPPEKRAAR